jgi:putative MFS transporter
MPLVFLSGPLIDRAGRRVGAIIIFGLGAVGTFLSYTLHGQWPLTGALVFGIFGASATLSVLNAFTTELFPTELRGDAFAWCNNVIGRIGYVTSPLVVGAVAEELSWGAAVRVTAVFPVIAVVLILVMLPETGRRDLSETSRV